MDKAPQWRAEMAVGRRSTIARSEQTPATDSLLFWGFRGKRPLATGRRSLEAAQRLIPAILAAGHDRPVSQTAIPARVCRRARPQGNRLGTRPARPGEAARFQTRDSPTEAASCWFFLVARANRFDLERISS